MLEKRRYIKLKSLILYIAVFAGILVAVIFGVRAFSGSAGRESKAILEQAIDKAVVTCYALEGFYPPSIEYLKENYGIQVDEEKYVVDYDIFAVNIMPEVTLIEKGQVSGAE